MSHSRLLIFTLLLFMHWWIYSSFTASNAVLFLLSSSFLGMTIKCLINHASVLQLIWKTLKKYYIEWRSSKNIIFTSNNSYHFFNASKILLITWIEKEFEIINLATLGMLVTNWDMLKIWNWRVISNVNY